jgi:hypothetical protein
MLDASVTDEVPESKIVRESLATAVQAVNQAKWDDTAYSAISQVQRKAALGVPCKIRGSIKTLGRVIPVHFEKTLVDTLTLIFEDSTGNVIRTTPISSDDLLKRISGSFHQHQTLDFLGCAVSRPIYSPADKFKGLSYEILLADITHSDDALQIIQATPDEITAAEKLVKRLSRKNGAILEHIRGRLIDVIGIKGIEKSPLLDRSLCAIILQALSDGYDAKRSLSHKLHSLVVGSPAVGKKLLSEAVRILNPVSTEAHPAKVTVAGLAGRAVNKNGEWRSEPGLIPLAHRGTFLIQDFHSVRSDIKRAVMAVLSMVMEDGRVVDATAAKQSHHALTAIHLDTNKISDVVLGDAGSASSGGARLKDLGVPMNVLSRFDFATEIPRDVARQMEIALEMQTGIQRTTRYPSVKVVGDAERQLKVLVAYLRSKHAEVEIPADIVENNIRFKQQELLDKNRDRLDQIQLLGDYQTRLSNSIQKYVFAISRGNARSVATAVDVDEAFRFIATKLDFLAKIEAFETPASWDAKPVAVKIADRQRFILTEFAGKNVTVESVLPAVQARFGKKISVTTIRRDLNAVAEKPAFGIFRLPGRQNGKMEKFELNDGLPDK